MILAVWYASLVAVLMFWLLAMSCGMWLAWLIQSYRGDAPWSPQGIRPAGRPAWGAVVVTVLYLSLSLLPRQPVNPQQIDLSRQIVVNVFLFALLLLPTLAARTETGSLAERGMLFERWGWQIWTGLEGFLWSLAPVAAMLLVTFPLRTEERLHPLLRLIKEDPSGSTLLQAVCVAVILAPLIEELMFRVTLQGLLERYISPRVALVGTAVIFSAVHGLPDALPLVPLALLLGITYRQSRSYLAVVTMHAAFNLFNVLLMLAGLQLQQLPPSPESPLPAWAPVHDWHTPARAPLPPQLPASRQTAWDEHD